MKFLVFGSKGWIGGQVIALLTAQQEEVLTTELRADDTAAVEQLLLELKPDRVLCLLGRTHGPGFTTIDYLEQKGKLVENLRDNLYAPISLGLLCSKHKIHLTYLGTGCIFEYDETHLVAQNGFTESDVPNFTASSYSAVKGITDRLAHQINMCTVRIRMPLTGTTSGRNFITKIVNYKRVVNVQNSMTVLHTLLPVMIDLSRKEHNGVVNLTNPGTISHNEVLSLYKQLVDPSFKWENFSVEEQEKILLGGRSNCKLDSSYIEKHYPSVPHIAEAVRECMVELGKSKV